MRRDSNEWSWGPLVLVGVLFVIGCLIEAGVLAFRVHVLRWLGVGI